MLRASVLTSLLAVGAGCTAVAARPQAPPSPPMSLEQLDDKLYVLNGGCMCGNTLFYIADGGVVMVDTKVAGQGSSPVETCHRAGEGG